MRRSRLAAARAGHVRKRGQPCGRQRNVGSPRGPHLMVSTSMVYGCIIDVFNTEDISAECSGEKPRHAPGFPAFTTLRSAGGESGCWGYVSRSLFRGFAAKGASLWDGWGAWLLRQLIPATNYPRHTCAKDCSCYTCNCCFRAGWNSPLAVNRAVPKGCCGAGEVSATVPMSPRPVRVLVRTPAELVRSQYQRLESG